MHFFFSLHTSRAQHLAPARTRTQVIQLGAQCSDHWTTEQSCDIGVPAVKLTTRVKSSTLYGRTVVRLYIQIFSAWWVTTTILYNYGAMLCELHTTPVVPYCATIFFKKINFFLFIIIFFDITGFHQSIWTSRVYYEACIRGWHSEIWARFQGFWGTSLLKFKNYHHFLYSLLMFIDD